MHVIEQAFGKGCDLYETVLSCKKDADKAALRKAYYRSALKVHPDKNTNDDQAALKFQAVTAAYKLLQDQELRAAYDESGVIPDLDPDDADEMNNAGSDQWKSYFDAIFGTVTTGGIEEFASKYKCSDEERRDVLKQYRARKGNLVKMLDFVMLSEPRDAVRWVEDYIRPAVTDGEVPATWTDKLDKTLKTLKAKVEKEDEDETESESDHEDNSPSRKRKSLDSAKSSHSKKAKSTKTKPKDDMSDLVAQIQNKRRGGGNPMASLGARYGVSLENDDPLDDKQFEKIQSTLKGKKRK